MQVGGSARICVGVERLRPEIRVERPWFGGVVRSFLNPREPCRSQQGGECIGVGKVANPELEIKHVLGHETRHCRGADVSCVSDQ